MLQLIYYFRRSIYRGWILHDIEHNTKERTSKRRTSKFCSEYELRKDTPYLTLTGELWASFLGSLGKKIPLDMDSSLYSKGVNKGDRLTPVFKVHVWYKSQYVSFSQCPSTHSRVGPVFAAACFTAPGGGLAGRSLRSAAGPSKALGEPAVTSAPPPSCTDRRGPLREARWGVQSQRFMLTRYKRPANKNRGQWLSYVVSVQLNSPAESRRGNMSAHPPSGAWRGLAALSHRPDGVPGTPGTDLGEWRALGRK